MGKRADQIEITANGEVLVEGADTRFRLRNQAGRYWLITDAAGLLILRRVLPEEDRDEEDEDEFGGLFDEDGDDDVSLETADIEGNVRAIFVGEILTSMTLFQVIETIAARNWDGDLKVLSNTGSVFELSFELGSLRHARSNELAGMLGQTLIRENVLTADDLETMIERVTEEQRLGDVLVARGFLTQEQLFDYLGQQIKSVFFRSLMVPDGSYVFTTPDPKRKAPEHTVLLPVHSLLMEGIQRIDEMELFRETIPTADVRLRRRSEETLGLDPESVAVLEYADEQHTLAEIAMLTGMGEFVTTKAAYHLTKRKRVDVVLPTRVDPDVLARFVDGLNDIVRLVFATVANHGDDIETPRATLMSWAVGSGYGHYFGETLREDGSFDREIMIRAIQDSRDDDPLATAHQIGHEFVSFALFSTGSVLKREVEKDLAAEVHQRLQSLRAR